MAIQFINHDKSYPYSDSFHDTNVASQIRFITVDDANSLAAHQRVQGDVVNRFIRIEDKVNEVITALNGSLASGGTNFILINGSRSFTGAVSGIDPTIGSHLATKSYVDARAGDQSQAMANLAIELSSLSARTISVHTSTWITHEYQSGQMQVALFPISPLPIDLSKMLMLSICERVNIGTPSMPSYVYRQLHVGGSVFGIDDAWIRDNGNGSIEVAIPNTSSYPNYVSTDLPLVESRELKATILTGSPCDYGESSSSNSSDY